MFGRKCTLPFLVPDKPKQSPKQVVQGCLIIIVLGAVLVGGCVAVFSVCEGDSEPQPESSRSPASADVKLTTLDRECLRWAHLTGLRAQSFTEQDIRDSYTHWLQNVVIHCRQLPTAARDICSEMERDGLDPRNDDDLYTVMVAYGDLANYDGTKAAIAVWCD